MQLNSSNEKRSDLCVVDKYHPMDKHTSLLEWSFRICIQFVRKVKRDNDKKRKWFF